MLSRADNELLTRVEGDAPMGRMLREWFWVPAIRAARNIANDRPTRLRFFGRNYVLFRAEDGRLGMLDEACPHRGVSLALAKNKDCALTCIFHGWKIGVDGKLLEVPNQAVDPEGFASKVKIRTYPAIERGGLVWAYLGDQEKPPRFPDFEFTSKRAENVVLASSIIDCNWVQGLDAALDSSHIAILHKSHIGYADTTLQLTSQAPPVYDYEKTDYGVRAAAIRTLTDGQQYVRVTDFVMPWYGFMAGAPNNLDRTVIMAVPIDDTHMQQWYVRFNFGDGPCQRDFGFSNLNNYDEDDFLPIRGGADQYWGQDVEALKKGHWTGFTKTHLIEDIAVQLSMGPIVDRSAEILTMSDIAVVQVRRRLLTAVKDYMAGNGAPPPAADPAVALSTIQASAAIIPAGAAWREAV